MSSLLPYRFNRDADWCRNSSRSKANTPYHSSCAIYCPHSEDYGLAGIIIEGIVSLYLFCILLQLDLLVDRGAPILMLFVCAVCEDKNFRLQFYALLPSHWTLMLTDSLGLYCLHLITPALCSLWWLSLCQNPHLGGTLHVWDRCKSDAILPIICRCTL